MLAWLSAALGAVVVVAVAALLWRRRRRSRRLEVVDAAVSGPMTTLSASEHTETPPVSPRPGGRVERGLERLLTTLPVGVLLAELDTGRPGRSAVIRSCNEAMERYLSVPADLAQGVRLVDVLSGMSSPAGLELATRLGELLVGQSCSADIEMELWPGLGIEHFTLTATRVDGRDVSVTVDNTTRWRQLQDDLVGAETTDLVTGVLNRPAFVEAMKAELASPDRAPSLTVVVLNLDRFRDVNEAFGMHRGDAYLRQVAARIQDASPGVPVGRVGDDEFGVITDVGPDEIARRLHDALRPPIELTSWLRLQATARIGSAVTPDDGVDADTLLVRAGIAVRAGKGSNARSVRYVASTEGSSSRRMMLLGDLRRGLAAGELVLHFQPVENSVGKIVAAEGLVRWHHPDLGIVFPGEFIELAELGSLSEQLAIVVAEQAIAFAVGCRDRGAPISVAVNLTAGNLGDAVFINRLAEMVEQSDVAPGTLTVELTERHMINNSPETLAALARLRQAGMRVAIDDFGTGATSLYTLRSLEIDELKIDRVFVEDFRQGHDVVVRFIVELAHDLGLMVVAEGVEDDETRARLRQMQVDRLQGYAIGHPVTTSEFTDSFSPN